MTINIANATFRVRDPNGTLRRNQHHDALAAVREAEEVANAAGVNVEVVCYRPDGSKHGAWVVEPDRRLARVVNARADEDSLTMLIEDLREFSRRAKLTDEQRAKLTVIVGSFDTLMPLTGADLAEEFARELIAKQGA